MSSSKDEFLNMVGQVAKLMARDVEAAAKIADIRLRCLSLAIQSEGKVPTSVILDTAHRFEQYVMRWESPKQDGH